MKKFSLLVLSMLFLSACDKVTDVDFSTSISKKSDAIVVNDPNRSVNNNTGVYETEFVIDLDNPDTHDYLDRINDIDLSGVRLIFEGLSSLSGNQTPTALKITINNQLVFEYNNFTYNNVANGQDFMIEDASKINELAQMLQSQNRLTVKIEGLIPDTAMYQFYITFKANANITASAL